MSKYDKLRDYVAAQPGDALDLSFDEIGEIAGVALDHSFPVSYTHLDQTSDDDAAHREDARRLETDLAADERRRKCENRADDGKAGHQHAKRSVIQAVGTDDLSGNRRDLELPQGGRDAREIGDLSLIHI